jgi:hypothetical protein
MSACQQTWPRGETYLLLVWNMATVIPTANADPVLFPTCYLVKPPLQTQRGHCVRFREHQALTASKPKREVAQTELCLASLSPCWTGLITPSLLLSHPVIFPATTFWTLRPPSAITRAFPHVYVQCCPRKEFRITYKNTQPTKISMRNNSNKTRPIKWGQKWRAV